MHTTPASSSNTPPTLHTHLANHQQIKDAIHTSQTHRPQRLTFTTHNERPCNDTNSNNTTNITIPTDSIHLQSSRGHLPRPSNSVLLEYIQMGNCTCVCRHCAATFWDGEKKVRLEFGGSPI